MPILAMVVSLKVPLILSAKPKVRDKDQGYCSIEGFQILVEFDLEVANALEARIYLALKDR